LQHTAVADRDECGLPVGIGGMKNLERVSAVLVPLPLALAGPWDPIAQPLAGCDEIVRWHGMHWTLGFGHGIGLRR